MSAAGPVSQSMPVTQAMPVTLVMPMAGAGSRFAAPGLDLPNPLLPKPLLPLGPAPFFAWALAGIEASLSVTTIVCVVRAEHVARHGIDRQILARVPQARLVVLDAMTGGAAETAYHGVRAVLDIPGIAENPLILADCDVAVVVPGLRAALKASRGTGGGVLTTFPGRGNPAYSYAVLDAQGRLTGTVEKRAASPHALAGCYGFGRAGDFPDAFEAYRRACPYPETFVSGIFDAMIAAGVPVALEPSTLQAGFGTPAELETLDRPALFARLGPHLREAAP
ncbi:hypothetical protein [Methylobacterium sp. J-090]|uniref:hypothetical protein n=1 Tax=Methylobacterium sp. J-090 TaxID=2836666 RepID=UPI001FB98B63|nr:hypothetical protein [Methylobacterium sp. J-090]MCJ2081053.1 hypothetical protein [Methylobacterium sp. J-090]